MSLSYKAETKTNIAIVCALLMLLGFFLSRALLSFAIVAFGVNALAGIHPKKWLKDKWWLLSVLWIALYFLTDLFNGNTPVWDKGLSVKMPLLLLPLSFGLLPAFSKKQIWYFTLGAAFMFLGSISYSLYFLFSEPEFYIEQYRFSKVLPTLAGHDYIRYSLSIALFIVWCFYMLKKVSSARSKWFLWLTIAVLSIYVHVIAVKTGILVLYAFVFLYALYTAFSKRPITGIAILAIIYLSAVGAYKYVPTFEQKIDYFKYSWKVFGEGHYDSDYSDIGRLVSYDVALKKMQGNLWIGTGISKMHDVMRDGYKQWYPDVPPFQQLKPHNQFLIVALGCGIPALLIFLVWMFYPLIWVKKSRDGFFLFAVWLLMFVPLMVEPFLELQLGVYVYLFFLLFMIHTVRGSNILAKDKLR